MTGDAAAVSLAQVVGGNARRLRGKATTDAVAQAARRYGLTWDSSRVSFLERGKVSPTVPTLIAVTLALADVTGTPVTLDDLTASNGPIVLTDVVTVTAGELRRLLRGERVAIPGLSRAEPVTAVYNMRHGWPARLNTVKMGDMRKMAHDYGLAEERLARDLRVDQLRLCAEMAALWGRSYSVERDARAGAGASAQKRGRVSRELKAELRAVIDGDNIPLPD